MLSLCSWLHLVVSYVSNQYDDVYNDTFPFDLSRSRQFPSNVSYNNIRTRSLIFVIDRYFPWISKYFRESVYGFWVTAERPWTNRTIHKHSDTTKYIYSEPISIFECINLKQNFMTKWIPLIGHRPINVRYQRLILDMYWNLLCWKGNLTSLLNFAFNWFAINLFPDLRTMKLKLSEWDRELACCHFICFSGFLKRSSIYYVYTNNQVYIYIFLCLLSEISTLQRKNHCSYTINVYFQISD